MASAFSIRAATASDIARVSAIYAIHVLHGTATFEIDPPDHAEMLSRFNDVAARGLPYLVAERAGAIIGYAYAGPFRTRPAYRFTVEDSIYLDANAQRQGVGRALLERLIEACTTRGARQMIAVIGDSANAGSIALHRRCGFNDAGLLMASGFKFGRWIDTVLMQRALGPGARSLPDPAA